MSSTLAATIRQVFHEVHLPAPDSISFPQVVSRLLSAGVTRYHVNYVTSVATAYAPNESPVTVDIPKYATPAKTWSEEKLKAAIKRAQGGMKDYDYETFVKDACGNAGVTDYFACLTGKRVVYLSGEGDIHTEWFPGCGPNASK